MQILHIALVDANCSSAEHARALADWARIGQGAAPVADLLRRQQAAARTSVPDHTAASAPAVEQEPAATAGSKSLAPPQQAADGGRHGTEAADKSTTGTAASGDSGALDGNAKTAAMLEQRAAPAHQEAVPAVPTAEAARNDAAVGAEAVQSGIDAAYMVAGGVPAADEMATEPSGKAEGASGTRSSGQEARPQRTSQSPSLLRRILGSLHRGAGEHLSESYHDCQNTGSCF